MLTYVTNDQKTFEMRMAEAIADIPLYTDEWTNFNPSDPGITILETVLGFGSLQQESMDDIPFRVKQNLLKMVGFQIQKGRSARLLLSASNVKEETILPANHKIRLGELVFETNREITLSPKRLLGVYGKKAGEDTEYVSFNTIIDRETTVPALVFGENPTEQDCLYLIADGLPERKKDLTLFIKLRERYNRNPATGQDGRLFADIVWEIFTEDGWVQMDTTDYTDAFLQSGEIRLWMPDEEPAIFTEAPDTGYAIRARLVRSEYDVRPKVVSIEAFLFEVWQKNTVCECHSESRCGEFELYSELSEEAYIDIFCREGKGESCRKYTYNPDR